MGNIKYPVGEQSFLQLREGGFLYVDKTKFIEKILDESKYYFLGRPRRFGKSLFLSTIKCFFEGRRELFNGLYADTMNWDWSTYPVLHLDLNIEKYQGKETLTQVLESHLINWERKYEVTATVDNLQVRFQNVIESAYRKTGKGVAILVDEYDKPLVSNIHNSELFDYFRNQLAAIYSIFKSSADYLRLVFLTGVSRFAHLTVFSGLNNIKDISFTETYSDICGITENELNQYFYDGISRLAETYDATHEETSCELKKWYDGYKFSPKGKEIYNPYSLLTVFSNLEYGNYWIQSGQPTLLYEQLKKFNVNLENVFESECSLDSLKGFDLDDPNPLPLFYQTGYLTIKEYDPSFRTVRLGLPNKEVTDGFLNYLLQKYVNLQPTTDSAFLITRFVKDLYSGNVKEFMSRLESFFAGISYQMKMDEEKNVHNALLIFIKLLGLFIKTELCTSDGRIDLFIRTEKFYYIIEVKLNGSAQEAIDQINDKAYTLPFACDRRKIFKIGISFSSNHRRPIEWIAENDNTH